MYDQLTISLAIIQSLIHHELCNKNLNNFYLIIRDPYFERKLNPAMFQQRKGRSRAWGMMSLKNLNQVEIIVETCFSKTNTNLYKNKLSIHSMT